jgi:hypothetical protein
LPFWEDAYSRLKNEGAKRHGRDNPFVPLVTDFARFRLAWAKAVVASERNNDPQQVQAALGYAEQTNLAQANIDRLKLRIMAESLPRSLSDSGFGVWLSELVPGHAWHCIEAPPQMGRNVPTADSGMDGPAQRHAANCLAQRLFLTGSYTDLDAQIEHAVANLGDLPDGGSSLDGIYGGLLDLFEYGSLGVEDAFRRTAQWRHEVMGSPEPDLVEAMIFNAWAYTARGHGFASSVSPQALQLYLARSEMAAVTLREGAPSARNNPLWYQLTLAVGRDQSLPLDRLEAIFHEGSAKFPGYLPLYRSMLGSLMPRWGGSIDLVHQFIIDEATKAGHGQIDPITYARLYLIYGNLEGDDFNVVISANADPTVMDAGLNKLRQRYPWSDYILNVVARASCIDNDFTEYRAVRPSLKGHVSLTAWPDTLSLTTCDKLAKS